MRNQNKNVVKPKYSKLTLQVPGDQTVQVIPSSPYGFLMDTETVANGYGVGTGTIRMHAKRHEQEIKEGVHYVKASAVGISDRCVTNSDSNSIPYNKVFWTKAGVVRLGFFVRSERAVAFRDWAEALILEHTAPKRIRPNTKPAKRINYNLLENLLKITNEQVRLEIYEECKKGGIL